MAAPEFRIVAIELYERPVALRIPFRFGCATVTHAPQAFVRAGIEFDDRREARGAAAELDRALRAPGRAAHPLSLWLRDRDARAASLRSRGHRVRRSPRGARRRRRARSSSTSARSRCASPFALAARP